jgi:Domain of unknown function (DUF4402)
MTKQLRLTLIAACAAGLAVPAVSLAASATASSSSTVVVPITITKSADLEFGKFAAGTGGTVTVSTSGARTVSGAVVAMSGTAPSAAKFDVSGETGATYSISLSGPTVLTSGSDTMAFTPVSDLTGANAVSGTVTSGSLSSGSQSIHVGGVLTVGSSQAPGTYTGSVIASVDYN